MLVPLICFQRDHGVHFARMNTTPVSFILPPEASTREVRKRGTRICYHLTSRASPSLASSFDRATAKLPRSPQSTGDGLFVHLWNDIYVHVQVTLQPSCLLFRGAHPFLIKRGSDVVRR